MGQQVVRLSVDVGGKPLTLETGRMAKQAHGAVLVEYGETMVLVTAVGEATGREGIDFFPLTVDYLEKTYAAGRIPGGFFKREGRPSEREVQISRLIDRPVRPLFPKGYRCETQLIAIVLSADQENDPDVLALTGASAALMVSDIPFNGPIAGVRVGRINGEFVVNPTVSQMRKSDIDLIIAASRDAVIMVEAGAQGVPEDDMLAAIAFGHDAIRPVLDLQEELRARAAQEKRPVPVRESTPALQARVESAADRLRAAMAIPQKAERREALARTEEELLQGIAVEFPDWLPEAKALFRDLEKRVLRQAMVRERRRIDGRGFEEIRPIACEVGILPRAHGSGLFTRGETQVLAVTTLGTAEDEQKIESLIGEHFKSFMLHYNFPPFCVGEVKFLRGPARREIGHGLLAERALRPILPTEEAFPYTIRIVSDVLESNGSSSMATVCGGTLSLMDAGVPISRPVAGIAMGLLKEDDEYCILSDILGDEDHLGDMDFKVAGTREGITALQMDIKIAGVPQEVMRRALHQAREARLFVLGKMAEAIDRPRLELSAYAPRMVTIRIRPERIKDVIGPGGKHIKHMVEVTGCKIDVEDDGQIKIFSADVAAVEKAIKMIRHQTGEAEIGQIYLGKVKKIVEFGAFVEILPGTDGLVHISQLSTERVKKVTDVLKEGDEVLVKVIEIDAQGRVKLSRKEALGHTVEDAV
ncbi:MAG: polyribonucleotide nucleotidyltransferase [Deltaproteobacteria bacterium]|nr:polyribonucleotide nucleotidyltransferase [Deltaproteobacteria bacterium]MBI3076841.1 polyribonucleotide nucleotidyltransferase [Deltaproteobacteria bacterium]